MHVTGEEPVQTAEALQTSTWVQALPSLHAVLTALAGSEQTPVVVLQTPTSWH